MKYRIFRTIACALRRTEREKKMKIDWKRKLGSRKFWAAIAAFATSIFAVFGLPEMTVGQITAIITAVGSLVVYILAETEVDKAAVEAKTEDSRTDGEE